MGPGGGRGRKGQEPIHYPSQCPHPSTFDDLDIVLSIHGDSARARTGAPLEHLIAHGIRILADLEARMESDAAARCAVVVVHALGDAGVHLVDVEATVVGLVFPDPVGFVGPDAGGGGNVPVGRVEGGIQGGGWDRLDGGGDRTTAHVDGLMLLVGGNCGSCDDGWVGGNVDDHISVADDRCICHGTCVVCDGGALLDNVDVVVRVSLAGSEDAGLYRWVDLAGEGSGGHVGGDSIDAAGGIGVVEVVGGLAEDALDLSLHNDRRSWVLVTE